MESLFNHHSLRPHIPIASIKKLPFLLPSLPVFLFHWSEQPLAYTGVWAQQSEPCRDLCRAQISRAACNSLPRDTFQPPASRSTAAAALLATAPEG